MMAVDPKIGGGGAGGGGTRGSDGSSDDGRHRSTIEMDDPDPGYASDPGDWRGSDTHTNWRGALAPVSIKNEAGEGLFVAAQKDDT